jgi:hypothetical protein
VKRPAIGPFLATGVVLVGAAAIVANPVVLPPADIRVSAADFAASSNGLDLLDPRFLESIGAGGWQNPVEVLKSLLSGLVRNDSDVDHSPLASQLAGLIDVGHPDLLMSTLAAVAIGDLQADGVLGPPVSNPGTFAGLFPVGGAQEVVDALAHIGEGFGKSGVTFLQQVGMAPAVVAELAKQVQAGTLKPEEALRRLITVPLTALSGNPQLTGNPEIDSWFTTGFLQPAVDALVGNPAPVGQQAGTADDGAAEVAAKVPNTVAPSVPQSSGQAAAGDGTPTAKANTATPSVAEAAAGDGTGSNTEKAHDTTNGNRPPSKPGGLLDQVTKIFKNLGGGNGQKPGQGAGPSGGSAGPSPGNAGNAGSPGSSAGN